MNQVILSIKLPVKEINVVSLWSDFITIASYHNGDVSIEDGALKWRIFKGGLIELFLSRNPLFVLKLLNTYIENILKIIQSYSTPDKICLPTSASIACNNC